MAFPNILFAGDTHGNFKPIVRKALEHKPDAVILLGDMDAERPLDVELSRVLEAKIKVWWIHGNHDCDNELLFDNTFGSSLADRNIHAKAIDVGGLRIGGLGGLFKPKIWENYHTRRDFLRSLNGQGSRNRRWRGGLPLEHRDAIFREDFDALCKRGRIDVLVTHEAPSTHENGSAYLDELATSVRASFLVHGHHHEDYRRQLGKTQVIGVGRAGVSNLEMTLSPGLDRSGNEKKDDFSTKSSSKYRP